MKKIQRELKTYKDIYVSVDGKEFDNETDCKAWETSYKGTLAASWAQIKKVDASSVNLGLPWNSDDHECYAIKPQSLEEITLINAYIQSSTCNHNDITLLADHIGKLVILNFGYDHDYCDVYVPHKNLENITKYIITLEDEINGKIDGNNEIK